VWLPDVGNGEIPPALEAWYQARLTALTQDDPAKPVVVFCHPDCWASWNAAKRAIGYGYRRVYWYPDGVEGWQDSGRATEVVRAEKRPG
jgi:PQQ-dependent catabolism-associated CXXCW motif protein